MKKKSQSTKPVEDSYIRLRWRNLEGETIFNCVFKKNLGLGDFETFMRIVEKEYVDNVLNGE